MSNPNEIVRLYNSGGKIRSMPRATADYFLAKNEGWKLADSVEAPATAPESPIDAPETVDDPATEDEAIAPDPIPEAEEVVPDTPAAEQEEVPEIASSEPEEAVTEEAPVAKPKKKAKKRSARKTK